MSTNINQSSLSYFRKPIQGRIRDLRYRAGNNDDVTTTISKNSFSDTLSEFSYFNLKNNDNSEIIDVPKKINKKSAFILSEADVSGEGFDDTQLQTQFENSEDRNFIDDNSDYLDETSIYLKSTKDLVGPQNKYKLKFDRNKDLEIKSQRYGSIFPSETDEENEYRYDSFCDDEIIYISDTEDGKKSSMINNKTPKNLKRNLKKPLSSTPINLLKRRRIIIEDDDD